MGEQNNERKLFPPTDEREEFFSLEDDEELSPPEEQKHRKNRKRFPYLLLWMLLFAALLAFFLFLSLQRRGDAPTDLSTASSDVSHQGEDASQAMAQSDMESEGSSSVSAGVISLPEESAQSDVPSMGNKTPEEELHGWIINSMGYTYLYYGMGVEQFNYSDATLERYLNSIRSLAGMVPDGCSVYCMPVPTRIGFLYADISDDVKRQDNFFNSWQQTFLNTVEDRLRPAISVANLYESFAEAYFADDDLFFRTDKNWTSDAAYLAYQVFCSVSGNTPVSLSSYEQRRMEGFLGSFYAATGAEVLRENADMFRYYQNAHTDACRVMLYSGGSVYDHYTLAGNAVSNVSSLYSVYLGTEGQRFVIESPCTSGKKLLVVGDGSAAAMLPFLIENYSEIQYIDVASYPNAFSELFQTETFHDVLFMSYVTNAVKGEYPTRLATMAGIMQEDEQTNG